MYAPVAPAPAVNRAATRVPGAGTSALIKPKRAKPVTPVYPEVYRAQNLEADVVVEVVIDVNGKVKSARILSAAPHADFNDAALNAAKAEEFTPAMRDGVAIEFTQAFTVRFRLAN